MKIFIAFLITFLLGNSAFSQDTINNSDMPGANDTLRLSITNSTEGIDYTETGENYLWDFKNLTSIVQQVDTFVNSINTPILYQFVFIPGIVANLAQPIFEFDLIPGFEVTDAFQYFKNSESEFSDVGFAVTVMGLPLPIKYDKADIWYKFPLSFGQHDSSASNYAVELMGMAYVAGWKKRVNLVDGWGTLLTPFGEFETLRVKTLITQYDSIYIDTLGIGFPILRNFIEYKWLGKDFGLPLLKVTEEGPITTVAYLDSLRGPSSGLEERTLGTNNFKIWPNPAREEFTITINEAFDPSGPGIMKLEVCDISGAIRLKQPWPEGDDEMRIKTTDLESGVYFVRLIMKDHAVINSKVIVL